MAEIHQIHIWEGEYARNGGTVLCGRKGEREKGANAHVRDAQNGLGRGLDFWGRVKDKT